MSEEMVGTGMYVRDTRAIVPLKFRATKKVSREKSGRGGVGGGNGGCGSGQMELVELVELVVVVGLGKVVVVVVVVVPMVEMMAMSDTVAVWVVTEMKFRS